MSAVAVWWADALLRSAWQAGLVALAVWLIFFAWKSAPSALKVWAWRLVLIKFFVVLLAPVPIERGYVALSTGSAARPLLPLAILALSAFALGLSLIVLIQDLRRVIKLKSQASIFIRRDQRSGCEVHESPAIDVPMLLGLGRPVILLPTGLSARPAEMEMAIAHELAHLRRRDLAWTWLAFAARSIFFFHPLVNLIIRELHVATETACDEEALTTSQASRQDYGKLLIELSRGNSKSMQLSVASAAGCSTETLKRRVTSLAQLPLRIHPLVSMALAAAFAFAIPGFRYVSKQQLGIRPEANHLDQTKVFSPGGKPTI